MRAQAKLKHLAVHFEPEFSSSWLEPAGLQRCLSCDLLWSLSRSFFFFLWCFLLISFFRCFLSFLSFFLFLSLFSYLFFCFSRSLFIFVMPLLRSSFSAILSACRSASCFCRRASSHRASSSRMFKPLYFYSSSCSSCYYFCLSNFSALRASSMISFSRRLESA